MLERKESVCQDEALRGKVTTLEATVCPFQISPQMKISFLYSLLDFYKVRSGSCKGVSEELSW